MSKLGLWWNGKVRNTVGQRCRRDTRFHCARLESLESRTLLSVSFANLGYTAPYPAPTGQLGQPSQTGNIFTDSFSDQTGTADTGVLADHYWNGQNTITRSLPTWLQGSAGVQQLSIEFWLKDRAGHQ